MTQHFCSLLIGQNKSCGPTQLRESRKEQPYPVLRRDSNGNIWWTFITNRVSQISLDLLDLFWLLLSIPELDPQLTLRNLGVPEAWPELTEAGKEEWSQRRLMEPGSQEVSKGQKSLVGCSPWSRKQLDRTEHAHTYQRVAERAKNNKIWAIKY